MSAPPISFEEGWSVIETGIGKLKKFLEGEPKPHFSYEHYVTQYTTIYNMCTQKQPHNYSQQLYDKFKETFEVCTRTMVLPPLREKHDEFMLQELVKRWSDYKVMVSWLLIFSSYLDRYFTTRRSLPSLHEVAITCFRDIAFAETKRRAKVAVIALINKEREGEQIDRALLNNVLGIYVEMGMGSMDYYEKDFETSMLADFADYYARKASKWIDEGSCADYLLKAEDCLKKENDRADHYFYSNSQPKVIQIVQNELLVRYSSQLLEEEHSGCRTFLRNNQVDDLTRLYKLLSKIPEELVSFAKVFKQHVTAEGMTLVQQANDAASNKSENVGGPQEQAFAKKLIDLYFKYHAYCTNCFSNDGHFRRSLLGAFEDFCVQRVAGCCIAELLSAYYDDILRKGGSEKLSDEAIEETLDTLKELPLEDICHRDPFVEFCWKKLAWRLLSFVTVNVEHERLMISKLRHHYGSLCTRKFEVMLSDYALVKEDNKQFNEYLSINPPASPGIDMSVFAMTKGSWPSYISQDLCLPSEMAKYVEVFEDFYQTKTEDRKLRWVYSLGSCTVNVNFDEKTIALSLRTYQAATLLLFNDSEKLSYSEIKMQLNLADGDVVRVLQSLSCAKYKILTKVPSSGTVSETDVFELNAKFTHRMSRIKIPLPPLVVEKEKTLEDDVKKQRRRVLEAKMVHIMKARKVLYQHQLVQECQEQLASRFKPDSKLIKKSIDRLITHEYLERDRQYPTMLRYIP